ncbi:conjugal transfer protein TraR [Salmonella enterica]|uniref:Conjugal transfer protein TraR n=1 Tax=Salmonella enterica TaxID=28901 RepID=A0A5Y5TD54_SALER|nr:TraR/DksA C4-type zinc finger protein [Salmonella enterica]EAA1210262.1 conjugal transfer protein TraR [Salmonella enterica subsp. enterica serovar Bareilly]EAA8755092.1 conjugal transfer protein TraR [Salmonella enterica subsp. enterica serovar Weltevreden]EAC0964184.1 conjugal transfer protein TraR [Salmonella enterica subsp. enterica serovar Newport]EBR9008014.1 conjugal transfer protein TraR [Salmonella enterica subsp. enterica serovar Richmond]EBU7427011.1 conjugal transfer protein Tra
MADYADIASEYEETIVNESIERIRSLCKSNGTGSDLCLDCGISIPEKRRLIFPDVKTCVSCQEIAEYRTKTTGNRIIVELQSS